MPSTTTIQIRSKGSITLPIELRRKYRLNEGDAFTLIDMGEGGQVQRRCQPYRYG